MAYRQRQDSRTKNSGGGGGRGSSYRPKSSSYGPKSSSYRPKSSSYESRGSRGRGSYLTEGSRGKGSYGESGSREHTGDSYGSTGRRSRRGQYANPYSDPVPQPPKDAPAKKRKLKNPQPPSGGLFSAKIVIAIFFLFVFVYIGHSIWDFWTPTVDTMIVRISTIDSPRSVTGIIIRDEQVFYAERDGQIEFWVSDNERVAVGAPVASVQNPHMVEAAVERLNLVEAQAIETQGRRHLTDTTVQSLNNNLNNIATARVHSFSTMNLSEIYSLRDNLNQVINTRNQINVNDGVSSRDNLAREQAQHRSVLEYNSHNMYARASGIMSRVIDGQENLLTRASIGYLTPEDVRQVVGHDSLVQSQDVLAGDSAFKIVGNVWYIAADMPNDMIEGFVEGTTRRVYLLNAATGLYEPHNLSISRIDYGTRYSLVVFRSTRHVIDFLGQRNVSIRTTTGVQRGLMIPYSAITTRRYFQIPIGYIHGTTANYVVVSAESGDIEIPVTVERTTDYNAYVSPVIGLTTGSLLLPLAPYEPLILLSSEHVTELSGVYLVRLGEAVFRAIDMGGSGAEMGYVLLDPALNPGIVEFANIVTDASTVQEGQLLR